MNVVALALMYVLPVDSGKATATWIIISATYLQLQNNGCIALQ
jgi:hypothetical protein